MAYGTWEGRFARLRKRLGEHRFPPRRQEVPFKVPSYLRDIFPAQYKPVTVSLGLNCYNRVEADMENCKADWQRIFLRWKKEALSSALSQNPDHGHEQPNRRDLTVTTDAVVTYTWDQFIKDLMLDPDVLHAYSWYEIDTSPVNPVILKNFLALDSLFLMLFLRYSCHTVPGMRPRLPDSVYIELQKQFTYKLLARARSGVWRDIFLLENQIPLHILVKVFKLMPDMVGKKEEDIENSFNLLLREVMKDRYLELFDSCASGEGEKDVNKYLSDKNLLDCDHLLDCFHYVVTYSPPRTTNGEVPAVDEEALGAAYNIPSASYLRKVGIKLNSERCHFIHEVKFDNSLWSGPVLHLPRLCITDNTDSLLRNLAVFEMVSWDQPPRIGERRSTITSFLLLMGKLLQSNHDVGLLKRNGIITTCGTNTQMIKMWNTLCFRFQLHQQPEWAAMLSEVRTRYKKRRHQYLAEFRSKYFARPWIVVSWVAAILLLVLTGMQSTYGVASYYSRHQ